MKVLVTSLILACALPASSQSFTSSDAADATERRTKRRAHMSADIKLLAGTRIVGPVLTMRAVRDDNASSMEEGLKAIRVVESAPPGSIVLLVLDGEKDYAVFGATFATLAKSRKLGGFIVDGAMRGVEDFQRLSMPLFARGSVAGSAGGHFRLASIGEPVMCGGVEVANLDFVVADADGVAVVPRALRDEAFAAAQRLRDEKQELLPLVAQFGSYTSAVQESAKKKQTAKTRDSGQLQNQDLGVKSLDNAPKYSTPETKGDTRMELGNFSVSLTVKDITKSREFYEKLGFRVILGNASQNGLILQNETATIGLFQGMFEKNILTFNPGWDRHSKTLGTFDDVRDIQKTLKQRGLSLATSADESTTGPASMSLLDPDGNTILIDQHVPGPKK